MCPQEGAHVANCQPIPVLGFLPWVQAHFGIRHQSRGLHGNGAQLP
jgi:hypothetical protein